MSFSPVLFNVARSVLPPVPTRAQVCAIRESLQGLLYDTAEFGVFPAWGLDMLQPADRQSAYQTHLVAGDTHCNMNLTESYKETGTLLPDRIREGHDWSNDLPGIKAIVLEAVRAGLLVDFTLGGDGQSVNADPQYGEYNDPVGSTYGHQWLMLHLWQILTAFRGDAGSACPDGIDLTKFVIFRPGWDAVFYGWEPEQVAAFGRMFRAILPAGYLAIEHNTGHIPCGEGGQDYAPGGLMQAFDTVMSEFDTVNEDSCWQIVARLVPVYTRPPDQPAHDDPDPPFYLAPGTDRGEYFYVAYEPTIGGVYQWCRGQCTLADVQRVRGQLLTMGASLTG